MTVATTGEPAGVTPLVTWEDETATPAVREHVDKVLPGRDGRVRGAGGVPHARALPPTVDFQRLHRRDAALRHVAGLPPRSQLRPGEQRGVGHHPGHRSGTRPGDPYRQVLQARPRRRSGRTGGQGRIAAAGQVQGAVGCSEDLRVDARLGPEDTQRRRGNDDLGGAGRGRRILAPQVHEDAATQRVHDESGGQAAQCRRRQQRCQDVGQPGRTR